MKPLYLRYLHTIRYRFFLFAGFLPYALGAATAFYSSLSFNPHIFLAGFLGLAFAFTGVEIFNEHFEPEDRLFYRELTRLPHLSIWLGAGCFAVASVIAVYLASRSGFLIIVFAGIGFLIAFFYVGPPLRLIYNGLGEVAIFLAYGPLMVLGSYYLHSQKTDAAAVFVSFIPGLFVFSLAILNEITDYYHDLLVGKRNILFRVGKKKGAALFITAHFCAYLLLLIGVPLHILPQISLAALIGLPPAIKGAMMLKRYLDEPVKHIYAVNYVILSYITFSSILILSLTLAAD